MDKQFKTSDEPLNKLQGISFSDLFNLADVQHLQDLFADAHGVASIITDTEGKPITKPSNFTQLCKNIIRKTEKGCASCYLSDAVIGRYNPDGPVVQTCLSGGLWDAGASITVGERHIANWLIGQVRNEKIDEQQMMQYAAEIGANKTDFEAALKEVPFMSAEQFYKIANLLFVFANELSAKAYTNFQLSGQIAEKEETNARIQEREENLAITLHSIGDGVISTDKNGFVVQMNHVAETLCGWKLSEALGKPLTEVFEIINAETRQSVADPVKKVLEKGEIVGLGNHTVLISRNGAEYQIADSAAPIKNKDGVITGVVLVFSDVTEAYLAQKLIKESEERYSNLLYNLEAGIVVHAPDTSIIMNNNRAAYLLGLSGDQMRGKAAIDPAWKFINEDNTQLPLEGYPVNRIISGKQPIKNQVLGIYQPNNNEIVWVTANGFPVLDNKGGITEIVISFIDITERKQAEEWLRESEERFKALHNASFGGITIHDKGIILECNHGLSEITGYSYDELIGMDGLLLIAPESRELVKGKINTGFEKPYEALGVRKNGELFPLRLETRNIPYKGKQVRTVEFRDITEQKESDLLIQLKTNEIEAQNEEYQQINEELNQTNQELAETLLRVEEREAIIKAAMENSQAGIAIAECPSGKLKYVNKAALLIRDKEYDEIVKDIDLDKYVSSWSILHFDGTPFKPDEVPLARAILYGETNSREFIVRRDTNEDRYVWANAAPIFNAKGIQTSAIVVFLDITERKLTEQALKKSEEKYQSIIQSQSEGIGVVNQNEVFEFTNLAAEKIFETGPGELIGASLYDFLHPDETGQINFQTGERQQGNSGTYEIHIITKKGNAKYILVSSSPKLDENKNYIGAYGVFRDITERRLLNDVHTFLSTSGYPGSDKTFF
ncbi:MAG: PAS domain S-box protein, partial [Bacteroidales bacterium]